MTKYVVKRILLMFLTLFIIMTICFILIKLLPLPLVKSINKAFLKLTAETAPVMVTFFC